MFPLFAQGGKVVKEGFRQAKVISKKKKISAPHRYQPGARGGQRSHCQTNSPIPHTRPCQTLPGATLFAFRTLSSQILP